MTTNKHCELARHKLYYSKIKKY